MNFFTPVKQKIKKDKKQIIAGAVDYLAINILLKFESPILISSEVMGVKKSHP